MAISIKGLGKDYLGEKDSGKEKEEDLEALEGSIKGRDISDVFDISLTEVGRLALDRYRDRFRCAVRACDFQ